LLTLRTSSWLERCRGPLQLEAWAGSLQFVRNVSAMIVLFRSLENGPQYCFITRNATSVGLEQRLVDQARVCRRLVAELILLNYLPLNSTW
jgi:hypothetical protein